jgi:hypothetical protein
MEGQIHIEMSCLLNRTRHDTLALQEYIDRNDYETTYLNDSIYDEIVFTSIPHSVARFANSSGVCTLCAPEIISSPTH